MCWWRFPRPKAGVEQVGYRRMSLDEQNGRTDLAAIRAELDADPRLDWLLRQKVTVPGPVPDYLDRPWLVERAMPTRNRVTAIVAPGGFGKTILLAECCRRLIESGIVTAWLSIDGDDGVDVLDAYLVFALRYAGLDVQYEPSDEPAPGREEYGRVGLLLRVLETREEPFVLVLDDLQRLSDSRSVALVEFLVRRGPPNLHLALACRGLPEALYIGGAILSGTSLALTVGDLRFTPSEITEFLGKHLSRRKLAKVRRDSAGWPMALRIYRNRANVASAQDESEMRDIVGNWVESLFWEGVDYADRELLLDAGLFEWMDEDLLAEVLDSRDAMRRIESMDELAGLLIPVRDGARDCWRLHPLIGEHCARQRQRHARQRYRELHGRIAVALARRGETLSALRHAAESADARLAGEILEDAGAVRLWIRYGLAAFQGAVGRLDVAVLSSTPRLRLVRCVWLLFADRLAEAREAYRAVATPGPEPATADGVHDPLWVDKRLVQGHLVFYGGESIGSEGARALMRDFRKIAASAQTERAVRGYAEHALCIAHNALGEFDAAEEWAARALVRLGRNPYSRMLVGFQLGQADMARGRVEAAAKRYEHAMRISRTHFVEEPISISIANVLLRELELERCRRPSAPVPTAVPAALTGNATPFLSYAAASGAAVGRALCEGDGSALAVLEDLLEYVHGAGLPALARYLTAMRVSILAAEDLADEAQRSWRDAGLPGEAEQCLDRKTQTWREMEAVSCARLRLSIAQERFEEARVFCKALRESSAACGLRRTLMRALMLGVVLEERAGEPDRQRRHLEEFLELFAETDYAWSAVCERRVCLPAVERFLEDTASSPLREPAQALLERMRTAYADPEPELIGRERQILSRLETMSDREIAMELGLTIHGVRYHLRNLFTKLGVGNRKEAARRARANGLLT